MRHIVHIIHLIETAVLYILSDVWDDGKNQLTIINLFKYATISINIWSVGEESIVMFQFTTCDATLLFGNDS